MSVQGSDECVPCDILRQTGDQCGKLRLVSPGDYFPPLDVKNWNGNWNYLKIMFDFIDGARKKYWREEEIFFLKEMNLFATRQAKQMLSCVERIHCHTHYTQHISLLSCYFSVKIHFLPFSKSLFHFMTATDVYVMRTLNTIFFLWFNLCAAFASATISSRTMHSLTSARRRREKLL